MSRPLVLDDLARFATVSDPQIAPDGREVAYTVETIDLAANATRSAIWLVGCQPGAAPRQLTAGLKHDTSPRWSPDGRTLAFVSDRDGKRQLYLLSMGGGEPRRLTDHSVGVGGPRWSPDGQMLLFLADGAERRGDPVPLADADPKKRIVTIRQHRHKLDGQGFFGPARPHVWVVSTEGGAAEQVTDGPCPAVTPAWSPDGRSIAFSSERSPHRDLRYGGGAIHVADRETGGVRRLTSEHGRATSPTWSADGRWIAYVGSESADDASAADAHLFVVPAAGGDARCLTAELGRSVGQRPGGYLTPSPPVWTGLDELCYLIGTGGATHLWRVPLVRLTDGDHAALEFSMSRDGDRAALTIADAISPPAVWVWDAADGLRKVADPNAALLAEVDLPRPVRRSIARPDGVEIEGWLLSPSGPASGPVPLVLSVHGGPHNYFGCSWNLDHQLYAGLGYAVLFVNPRGSGGYGEKFARQVLADWGGGDWRDQLAFLDATIATADPPIDPQRLAIAGSSYGGFMTCWAVTQTDRFAVGISGACIANLESFYGTSDIGASWGEREFGGPPWERAEWYRARSPLTHVGQVRTPLLLYHGEDDLRCPIEQSEQFFTALHRLGRDVELLRLPGETHGALAGAPAHRIEARRHIQSWLTRYLG